MPLILTIDQRLTIQVGEHLIEFHRADVGVGHLCVDGEYVGRDVRNVTIPCGVIIVKRQTPSKAVLYFDVDQSVHIERLYREVEDGC